MEIKRGAVFTPEGIFRPGSVFIEGDRFSICASGEALDAEGCYVLPGLVDIHIHGYKGADFGDGTPEALRQMSEGLAAQGVTSFLGTLMALPVPELFQAAEAFREYNASPSPIGASLRGIHLEGPFLSKAMRGAQSENALLPPDWNLFQELFQAFQGKILLADIAPELPGAIPFIQQAKKLCRIGIAHTQADYETALSAMEAGARHIVHLFNAMPPFLHRSPGVIGAAADKAASCELIADGLHIHPSVIRSVFRWFESDRLCLISDCMRAGGLPDGTYTLGGQQVFVTDGKAVLRNGALAGSAVSLGECLRRAISFGVPKEAAVLASTLHPARAVGLDHTIGRIAPGMQADVLIADSSFQPVYVLVGGKIVYKRN